jgi:hypothetical protein
MSVADTSGTIPIVRLYRFSPRTGGLPASGASWSLVHSFGGYNTFRRPTLGVMRDPAFPGSSQLVFLLAGTNGAMFWGEGPRDSVGASPAEWLASVPYYLTYGTPQVTIEAAAAIFDDRSSIPTRFHNLRVFRYPTVPSGALVPNPAGGTTCPLACPAGTTCTAPLQPFTVAACMNLNGDVISDIELNPFPEGPLPGVYADYNDWRQIAVGLCVTLNEAGGRDPLTECGPMPAWPEPREGGGMSLVAAPGMDDRLLRPAIYETRTYTCPGL